jgi:excinuclease UvrABC nuclease subunit
MYEDIIEFLCKHGAPPPDVIFDACLLDPTYSADVGESVPLHETASNNQCLSGCYAWIEVGNNDEAPEIMEVMYVGKAARLRNRLINHFKNSKFLEKWGEQRLHDGQSFIPFIACWFTDERSKLEVELIRTLSPKYNKQKE